MLSNVQRAEVESKSQLAVSLPFVKVSCYQMYKELKLKANHNCTNVCFIINNVVIKCTKSWSWKQITTKDRKKFLWEELLSNVQRAEVESKSQPGLHNALSGVSCYQMYKELKLKANHNGYTCPYSHSCVVIKCTKSWSWKQITTHRQQLP